MKTTLYYFTGTGNSLKVARDLAAKLGDTEIVPITKVVDNEVIEAGGDAVGIVSPVYMWGLPLIVARFAKKLKVSPAQYLFGVADFGGWQGGTTVQLQKIFAKRDILLSAGFGVKMPGNYAPMYGALPDEKQQKLFAAEKNKIDWVSYERSACS
jgi:flavodoxin